MKKIIHQDMEQRYQLARQVAQLGAKRAWDFYRNRHQLLVEHKGNDLQDVVSMADRLVEELIKGTIAEHFPDDDILGEETGGGDETARCIWVVDPIDGTSCFLNGLHTWCVSIGVIMNGEPVIGVVCDPNHQELFHACKGQGAFVNDAPIHVHPGKDVRDGVTGVGTSHRVTPEDFVPFLSNLLHAGGMFIRSGSGALMTAQVAAGRLIGYYEPHMNAWDSLPGLVLVQEAGGVASDFLSHHGLINGNPLLLANAQVYQQLKQFIPKRRAE
ncbi:inositol monophosphatase family protein [Brenneria corticis]|uniref:Nus factor SuhB n=1 Tax=Brenneria corticis TaxID=2173106 RepID=A0A2U1UDB6_9GAMM|nr:inositol monophosphatase [Brenneria sp. CFCC 11842]PWC19665.1 inositol monophosphatase [Brenneria sp. CFCC 11842]